MTAMYGPQTANAVLERPNEDTSKQRYGTLQSWFKNCSGPGATDGTVPDAAFYNRIIGALDYLIGITGISALPGDDSAIYRAIMQAVEGSAPTALNSLNELANALGNDTNFAGTVMTMLGNRLRFDAAQTLTSPQRAQALTNLGIVLSAVAASGAYNDLTGKPTLGTAAALDFGTLANRLVRLDGSARLPAVDGSQLTGVVSTGVSLLRYSAALGANVNLTTGNTFYDVLSLTLPNPGVYQVTATVTVKDSASSAPMSARLTDGTTVYASSHINTAVAGGRASIAMSAIVTNPAANVKIQAKSMSANTTGIVVFNDSGESKDTHMTAVKIA